MTTIAAKMVSYFVHAKIYATTVGSSSLVMVDIAVACLWCLLCPTGLHLETARAVYAFESGYEIPGSYRRTETRRIHTRSVHIW